MILTISNAEAHPKYTQHPLDHPPHPAVGVRAVRDRWNAHIILRAT
jgi:hypothetical protein